MKMTKRCLALVLALLLALGAVGALADVKINKTNFPDANFRKYVQQNIDTNGDGKLTAKEMNAVKMLELYESPIANLKGIENFKKLTYLSVGGSSKLKKVDLSKNSLLKELYLDGNRNLSSVKLGTKKKLMYLSAVDDPKLKSLDIGGCPILKKAVKQLRWASSADAAYGSFDDNSGTMLLRAKTKLMNGTKVLRKYAKPTAVAFTKKSVKVSVGGNFTLDDLGVFIKTTPANVVYPTKVTSGDLNIVDEDGSEFVALEEGTTTLTLTCGGKKATIKVTVE